MQNVASDQLMTSVVNLLTLTVCTPLKKGSLLLCQKEKLNMIACQAESLHLYSDFAVTVIETALMSVCSVMQFPPEKTKLRSMNKPS
jgi:hypothetical protein